MSDEDLRQIIEAATKESLRESFTDAGKKYLKAAEVSEQKGDMQGAEELYLKAIEAFRTAAERQRASKSFKMAALNICLVGDVYSDLADMTNAINAYQLGADDLFNASNEHLMWGEDSEVRKGTALAMAACMIYIMIGREADAFYKARTYSAENASKLRFPAVIRLSQIPQMLETAIQSVDISAFSEAENAVVTELRVALSNAGADEFVKYVDKGLNRVRELLRGKLRVPKVSAHLELPIDVTFIDDFTIKVVIQNNGEGEATNVNAEWFIDEGLTIMSGERQKSFPIIPPGESITMELVTRAAHDQEGIVEYSIMVRGSYTDKLNTEYSLQAGPGNLVIKDFKEAEKSGHAITVTEGRVSLLSPSIRDTSLEAEPLERVTSVLGDILTTARSDLEDGELETGKAKIRIVNDIVDAIDEIIGDDAFIEELTKKREADKIAGIKKIQEKLEASIRTHKDKLQSEVSPGLADWDVKASKIKKIAELVTGVGSRLTELYTRMEMTHSFVPSAATTEDPDLAATRTKISNALDNAMSTLKSIQRELTDIASHEILDPGQRPETPSDVARALEILDKLMSEMQD